MTGKCDACGTRTRTIGSRQTALLDVSDDPRVDGEAQAELRHGRILCTACARTVSLFPDADADMVAE